MQNILESQPSSTGPRMVDDGRTVAAPAVETRPSPHDDAVPSSSLDLDLHAGLRTDRRLSHIYLMDLPRDSRTLLLTDAGVSKLPSTLDEALCKMADRGQINGGLVDGPLAFNNAISPASADKGIVLEVAGCADILVAPDLESGNMVAKQLTFLAGADAAGVVLGARLPNIFTSRADSARIRLASCAVAVLLVRRRAAAQATSPDHAA